MAGTMIRLVRSGRTVWNVALTAGEAGTYGDPETRRREFEAAQEVMGTVGHILGFSDTNVVNDRAGRLKIASFVRRTRPTVVFAPYHTNPYTHHDGTANVDHFATGQVVRDGLKLARFRTLLPDQEPHTVRSLFYYMVPKDTKPTFVVDVSDLGEEIHASINAYATQMEINRQGMKILDLLDTIRRYHGVRIHRPLGEAFVSDEALTLGPEEIFEV